MTPGLGARGPLGGPVIKLMEPTRSIGVGGGSSLMQAFSNMFVHFPLVPA